MKSRFSGEEWAIRRLMARDSAFRACWADYEVALAAAERWRVSGGRADPRGQDFVALVGEIETEIQERLKAEEGGSGESDERP